MTRGPFTAEPTTIDGALARVLGHCSPLGTEDVALAAALGRYAAGPVVAPLDLPPFTGSAMDTCAVRDTDTPEVLRGAEVVADGVRIGAAQVGAVASLGLTSVPCVRQPRVAVLATGTELQAPGEPLRPGHIYNSNGPLLRALVESAGAVATVIPAAADTHDAHRAALDFALGYDMAISTGGVSVGGHDLVREVLGELGVREIFWRIAMKPGKPLSFGVREEPPVLVFGIPGNPASVLACFELFVRPALRALQGAGEPGPDFGWAPLSAPVPAHAGREELIRVRLTSDGALEPLTGRQSHQLAVTASADGLARIPLGEATLEPGTVVGYLSLSAG